MRIILILILIINCSYGFSQRKIFCIKGKLLSCSEYKDFPTGHIYLYKDYKLIDSINTYHSVPYFLGGYAWISGKFKFKGIENGKYEIRYNSNFDIQDYPILEVNNANIKNVQICFDKLPERFYTNKTMLDNLADNDTLFIDVFLAGGEFGGFDEGFWISKIDNQYYGRFYRLPNTYAIKNDSLTVIKTYLNNKSDIVPVTDNIKLSEQAISTINRFLNEINHYQDHWGGNAPEHFLIYTKYKGVYKVKNNSSYKPYIKLRRKVITGL